MLSGDVSGAGYVFLNFSAFGSNVILTGTNTYTGVTSVLGTLSIGNGGNSGTLAGDVYILNLGEVVFNRSGTYSYAGTITGFALRPSPTIGGAVYVTGGGTMIYTGTAVATVIVESGTTLQVGDGGTAGKLDYAVANDGTLIYNQSGTNYVDIEIGGTGSVILRGGGTYIFGQEFYQIRSSKTYSGDTIVEHATLEVPEQDSCYPELNCLSTVSSIVLNNASDVSLVFEDLAWARVKSLFGGGSLGGNTLLNGRSDLIVINGGNYAGVISGSGTFSVESGTMVLSGDNTYTGGTRIYRDATLQVGTGGASGSIVGDVENEGTLIIDRSGVLLLSGKMEGPGTLQKTGSGTLVLNGVNAYTGLTTVFAGTLEVGDTAHPTATLAGDVSVAAGAVLSGHGQVLGTISGAGTVRPGGSVGTLTVGSYTQNSDSTLAINVEPNGSAALNVTHTATLAGKLAITLAPGMAPWASESILTAGTIVGQFSSIAVSDPASDIYAVDYLSNAVVLTVEARRAGQIYGDVISAALDGGHALNGLLLDHRTSCQSGQSWCVWGSGFGGMGWFDTNTAEANAFKFKRAGAIAGLDAVFAGGQTIGFAVSFNQTSVTVSQGWGSALISSVSGAVTGSAPLWLGEIRASLFGTINNASSRRDLGSFGIAEGSPDSYTYGGAAEYGVSLFGGSVVPLAGISIVDVHQKAMAEEGVGTLGYSQQSTDFTSVRGELGVRLQRSFTTAGGVNLVPHLRMSMQQKLNEADQAVALELNGHPESSYYPSFAEPAITAFAATAALDISSGQNWDVRVSTGTRLSAREKQVVIGAGGSYRF